MWIPRPETWFSYLASLRYRNHTIRAVTHGGLLATMQTRDCCSTNAIASRLYHVCKRITAAAIVSRVHSCYKSHVCNHLNSYNSRWNNTRTDQPSPNERALRISNLLLPYNQPYFELINLGRKVPTVTRTTWKFKFGWTNHAVLLIQYSDVRM